MVQALKVTCPHCHQVAEIFLSTNACVVILNCPSCYAPIMYFDHKIFILSQSQVEAIKNRARSGTMMSMLKKLAQPEELPIKKNTAYTAGENRGSCLLHPDGTPTRSYATSKIHIGTDDITNLRIELALCKDVQEFIDKI